MPFLATRTPLKLAACAAVALLLVSCSSSRSTPPQTSTAVSSKPGLDINRAHKDGAPWWDVDVSRIPDATPTLHTGPYKAAPYSVLGKTYFPMQESSVCAEVTKFRAMDSIIFSFFLSFYKVINHLIRVFCNLICSATPISINSTLCNIIVNT